MPFVSTPNSGQSLGATRDQIRNNILDIKNSLAVNHKDLDNGADTGKHTMANFLQISALAEKPTTSATEVALYNDDSVTGQIWLCPPGTTQGDIAVLLTAGDVTDTYFSAFSNKTPTPTNTTSQAGWTFLPGGLLLQYGRVLQTSGTQPNTTGTVTFPIAFSSTPYSLTATWVNAGSTSREVGYRSLTTTNFLYVLDSSWPNSGGITYAITWQAIGPA